ncbi:MAG: hypothetical protein GC134_02615 [Proteobacteria bacterium]|nr:hypothetical protein [Pseudomonadota bacterium]
MLTNTLLAFAIGFSVSFFTLGPTTIMAIRRMFTHGFMAALLLGLGSAVADGMYAIVPAFGLRGIAEQLEAYHQFIELGGAIIMIVFGLFFVLWRKPVESHTASGKDKLGAFGTGWLLNAINPGNALAFAFGLTFFGLLTPAMTFGTSAAYTGAILIGSMVAWVLKVILVYMVGKERLNERNLNTVTYWMGWLSVILGAGLILYSIFFGSLT